MISTKIKKWLKIDFRKPFFLRNSKNTGRNIKKSSYILFYKERWNFQWKKMKF